MAKNEKNYPPGEKPLVVRRSKDGELRILSGLADELGLNTMFLHRGIKLGELTIELTIHTVDGDVKLRMQGFAETEKPPLSDGTPQDPHINWTDTRWSMVGDERKVQADG